MPKSPGKPEQRCKGCDYMGKSFRSHLSKSPKCKTLYDMNALDAEAKALHKKQMAARNRDRYQNDPDESPRKRAASKQLYNECPEKKKEAMQKHYQNSQFENVTDFLCHLCTKGFFTKKTRDIHIEQIHLGNLQPVICQICDKTFDYKQNLDRHMREVHGGQRS